MPAAVDLSLQLKPSLHICPCAPQELANGAFPGANVVYFPQELCSKHLCGMHDVPKVLCKGPVWYMCMPLE